MITIIKDMSMTLKLYQTTCNHCGSIFKHDETDLVKDLPKNATIEAVDCPVCKKELLLNASYHWKIYQNHHLHAH
jgi:predicted Zn-ribbon and HTH transcriptional regulator